METIEIELPLTAEAIAKLIGKTVTFASYSCHSGLYTSGGQIFGTKTEKETITLIVEDRRVVDNS